MKTLAPSILIDFFFILASNVDNHKSQMGSEFDKIRPQIAELAALERLEKSLYAHNWRNDVTTLVPSYLNGSSLFLLVRGLYKYECK